MRQTLFEVRTDLASTLIREGEFTSPAPGLTVYAQSVDATGLIRNLFIHQEKAGGSATTGTEARSAAGAASSGTMPGSPDDG